MTIRAKVLLFAAVAVVLVCVMGLFLFGAARQGQRLRQQLVAIQEQIDGYTRLHSVAWPFLNQLAQARQAQMDTALVSQELARRVDLEMVRLADSSLRQGRDAGDMRTLEQERWEQREVRAALLRWSALAERRVNELPANVSVAPNVEWLLYSEFEQTVGQLIHEVQEEARYELELLEQRLDAGVFVGEWVALCFPVLCLVLVVFLVLAILTPLRHSLQGLTEAAERIGHGDFDVHTNVSSPDELGTLARAIDRMARELRESLEEKQRLSRAEAEASEREAARYHALLEDTVRTRTTELAEANTRLRDSLQQLQSTQEQLLSADRLASVGRLAAGVGHEINNPLAYILSNLRYVHQELGELTGAPSEEARQEMIAALAEASEGAERVRLIVQDLKTLSRPDEVALGPVNVADVVRSSAKMARHETRDKARLVEVCEGVPPVHANAARLGQVFLNLFINAAHAIAPGRVQDNEIRVHASLSAPGLVTVEVSDTGAGIPPEYLRRIFDPFFTTKPVGMGTGLGLSVCHRIITSLGGDIRVESAPGQGTRFFITLRVAEGSSGSTESAA
ncbi:ATP-binding protein [Melittangium boletus]|uniref:histidine kinase n=1 Tax=Melittangium boletus DSM 14713 TaxID=1294270 RepID=A0A250IFM0_9BACT|nr:ATP-binding protein [Melittangium boletus]ATB30058.1 two-component sensor histidine kinase [Melittangium boletus DSM 14713]